METLNELLKKLDAVQGLTAVSLVLFSCIIVGYVLRFIKRFPNDGIPVAVILWGALAMLVLADPRASTMPARVWTMRNLCIGLVIGMIAWLSHKIILAKIEDFILSKFPGASNTSFFSKPDQSGQDPKPPLT
jgi:hypothetical protein